MKLDAKDELTKQYDVALKILKTKVDKREHLAETEENIKGTCYTAGITLLEVLNSVTKILLCSSFFQSLQIQT